MEPRQSSMVLSRFIIPSSEQKTYMGNGHISHGYEVSNSYTTESTNHRRKFTRLVWRNRNFSLEVGTFLDLVGLVTGIQEIHPSEKLDAARFDRQDGEGYVSMYVSILRTLVNVLLWSLLSTSVFLSIYQYQPVLIKLGKLSVFKLSLKFHLNEGDHIDIGSDHSQTKALMEWCNSASAEILAELL